MEGWTLPPPAARRLERLEALVARTSADPEAATLLRGGHWRNFLRRYSESNRMHKKAAALSALCRERGDPVDARQAIGRAQCNDAYWHGVFGGLYLRHLRAAIWANLAAAEKVLRAGEPMQVEVLDLDGDGHDDIWVHSEAFSALVAPARGGSIEELTDFARGLDVVDVLTRRREAYHREGPADTADGETADDRPPASAPDGTRPEDADADGMPSIHAIEEALSFRDLPPFDLEDRALLVDRVLSAEVDAGSYERADYDALTSWAEAPMDLSIAEADEARVTLSLRADAPSSLDKEISFGADGRVRVAYRWDPAAFPEGAHFAPELSVAVEAEEGLSLEFDPPPEALWRYEIRTVSKSESGSEESVQGVAITPLWPAATGEARLSFRWS